MAAIIEYSARMGLANQRCRPCRPAGGALVVFLIAAACTRPPVRDEVTIDFSGDDDTVVVTAETSFDVETRNAATRARIENARIAAQTNTDAWAARFARVNAEVEKVTFQKSRGTLDRVTRSARIHERELQQIFSDTNITVHLVHGDGWNELAFYPGSSTRASREQRQHFEAAMEWWSAAAARYFDAIHRLYRYMDQNPDRVRYLYAAILNEPDAGALEEERPLVDEVVRTMDVLAAAMDAEEDRGALLAEEADLLFNPFPGSVVVKVPGEGKDLIIERVDLLEAIGKLEGRWVSPDPLALLLHDKAPSSESLARMERRATAGVRASDVADVLREQLARPQSYVVRWRE
ncbi:MAG: hypothetical protein M3Q69_03635 [Acidobacteriota bacterium]|nr:hypothetical protein [Acidobacteriota bacterium]